MGDNSQVTASMSDEESYPVLKDYFDRGKGLFLPIADLERALKLHERFAPDDKTTKHRIEQCIANDRECEKRKKDEEDKRKATRRSRNDSAFKDKRKLSPVPED